MIVFSGNLKDHAENVDACYVNSIIDVHILTIFLLILSGDHLFKWLSAHYFVILNFVIKNLDY